MALYAAVLAGGVFAPAYVVAAGIGVAGTVGVAALQGTARDRSVSGPP